MPPKPKKVVVSNIKRILLKHHGWITIEPDSFNFSALDFYMQPPAPGTDPVFTGMTYLGFQFKDAQSGRLYCVPTDNIGGIEVDDPVVPPGSPSPGGMKSDG